MREIIFKAKRKDNNEWVYGQIVYDKDKIPFIVEEVERENQDEVTDLYATKWYEVIPETICQYTGLEDKNGVKIFENDIVKINGWWDASGPAGYGENKCVVRWDKICTGFEPMCNYDCDCGVYHDAKECEVIGNIYDEEVK